MSLGGNVVFIFIVYLFVYFVKVLKFVGDQLFIRYLNKLFENLRYQADKFFSWLITFLKIFGLQKNIVLVGANLCLFKFVFLEKYQFKIVCVYKLLQKGRYKCYGSMFFCILVFFLGLCLFCVYVWYIFMCLWRLINLRFLC